MRLALSEGRLTKWRDLYHELTPRALTELIAYYSLEPWGEQRADIRAAVMTAILVKATNGQELDLHDLANYMDSDGEGKGGFQSPNAAAAMMRQALPDLSR